MFATEAESLPPEKTLPQPLGLEAPVQLMARLIVGGATRLDCCEIESERGRILPDGNCVIIAKGVAGLTLGLATGSANSSTIWLPSRDS